MKNLTKNIVMTFMTKIMTLFIGIATSVIIARVLGPEDKGIYSLAILLPTLLVTLTQFGIAPATIYNTARNVYDRKQIFGNNILLSLIIGSISLPLGFFIILFFGDALLPNLPLKLGLLSLLIIPLTIVVTNLQKIFIGMQKIVYENILSIIYFFVTLILTALALFIFKAGIFGVLVANILSLILAIFFVTFWLYKILNGVSFSIQKSYIKSTLSYGAKSHLGNITRFLNLRADIFLVNIFINPAAVGFYSISVNIAEKLWLLSQATGPVLFPRIAAEKNKQMIKEITPIINRNILLITAIGAIALFFVIQEVIILLYTKDFSPAARPMQILLPGIVVGASSRIMAQDISGRGMPLLNSIIAAVSLIINIFLNVLWIPKFGIEGAAAATTVSYIVAFIVRTIAYSKVSGNSLVVILIPHRADLKLYHKLWNLFIAKLKSH